MRPGLIVCLRQLPTDCWTSVWNRVYRVCGMVFLFMDNTALTKGNISSMMAWCFGKQGVLNSILLIEIFTWCESSLVKHCFPLNLASEWPYAWSVIVMLDRSLALISWAIGLAWQPCLYCLSVAESRYISWISLSLTVMEGFIVRFRSYPCNLLLALCDLYRNSFNQQCCIVHSGSRVTTVGLFRRRPLNK